MALRVNATAAQYACGTLGQVGATPLRLVITEGSTRAIEATSELVCMLTLLLIVSLIGRRHGLLARCATASESSAIGKRPAYNFRTDARVYV